MEKLPIAPNIQLVRKVYTDYINNASWTDGSAVAYGLMSPWGGSFIIRALNPEGFPSYTGAVNLVVGYGWDDSSPQLAANGSICKKPAIPNMPTIHDGTAQGDNEAHDPSMLKASNGQYVVYSTHNGNEARISSDRVNFVRNSSAFPLGLTWIGSYSCGKYRVGQKFFTLPHYRLVPRRHPMSRLDGVLGPRRVRSHQRPILHVLCRCVLGRK